MTDNFSGNFSQLPSAGFNINSGGFAKPRKQRRQKQQSQEPQQELDPTLLQSLGRGALGVAGAVGNVLDLPGSSVRDVLAGKNPFDQWIPGNWTSDENRISGRDLLRQHGMIGKKDTWGNFAGGLAAEIATDPFTLLGAGLLGKTAKGAAALKAGQKLTKGLGSGIRAGDRALAAGKVPFGPHWAAGTGETAAKIGDVADKAWDAVRYSAPGRVTASAFSPAVMGRMTKPVQDAAAQFVYPEQMAGRKVAKRQQLDLAARLKGTKWADSDTLRREFEGVTNDMPADLKESVWRDLEHERVADAYMGRSSGKLDDQYTKYFPRYVNIRRKDGMVTNSRVFSGRNSRDSMRQPLFKGWKGGTVAVKEFFKDQDLRKIVEDGLDKKSTLKASADIAAHDKQVIEDLTKAIDSKYAGSFDQMVSVKTRKGVREIERSKALARKLYRTSGQTSNDGLFANHPLVDLYINKVHRVDRRAAIKGMNSVLSQYLPDDLRGVGQAARPTPDEVLSWKDIKLPKIGRARSEGHITMGRAIKDLNLDPKVAAGVLLRENGVDVTSDSITAVLRSELPSDVAKDLTGLFEKRVGTNAETTLAKWYKSYMSMFKAGVLSHPARHARDIIGGQIQNSIHGISRPLVDLINAHKVYTGGVVKGLTKDPEIQQWVATQGLKLNDETATQALRFLYAENGPGDVFKHTDITGSTVDSPISDIEHVLGIVPGVNKSTAWGNFKQTAKTFSGRDGKSTWNPFKAKFRGVGESSDMTFAPFATSDKIGEYTDAMNRLAPFINLKRQGYSAEEAMKRINDVQVNYDPRTFTATERMLKNIVPFYSYTSRMVKHTAKELATKPGGGLAQVVRLENAARDRSGTTPDHIADTAAIPDPFFKSKDGTKQYLSSIGLMHDDALQLFNPSLYGLMSEGASRLNPLLQKPLEYATGRSLFFKEPGGGRPLEDLDPTIGRILANVTGQEDAVRYPGDWAVEGANSLAPWSRATTTLRQLTDTRKSIPAKLLNTFTGMKVSTVSPQQQERTLRRKLEESARKLGARTFEQIYFPKDKTYTGQAKERVEAYQKLINALSKKAKTRAKDKVKDKKS